MFFYECKLSLFMTVKDNNLGFLLPCFKNCVSSYSLSLLVLLNFLFFVMETLFHVFMTVVFETCADEYSTVPVKTHLTAQLKWRNPMVCKLQHNEPTKKPKELSMINFIFQLSDKFIPLKTDI